MVVGIDPFRYIEEKDETKKWLLLQAANAAVEMHEKRDHNLAVQIANEVGKMFNG